MHTWLMKTFILFMLHGLFATCLHAQEILSDSLNEVFEQAQYDYNSGEYIKTINKLEGMLEHLESTEMVEGYKYLAFCYVNIGDETTARDYFKKALKIVPKLRLNTSAISPAILRVFRQAQKERAHEAAMCSCFIPGWGQMLKGEDAKARKIMVASGVTLLASTISWIVTQSKYDNYIDLGPADINKMDDVYKEYNQWYKTSLVASAIFLGIYTYSICDAMFAGTKMESSNSESRNGFSYVVDNRSIGISYTLGF